MKSQNILLIDDHAMFRDGLSMVIKMAMPGTTIFQAASVEEGIAELDASSSNNPDIVLLDIRLKGTNGIAGIAQLKQRWAQVPILMLSSQDEPETQRLAISRGAAAFVSKGESSVKIIQIIREILQGDFAKSDQQPAQSPNRALTPRQLEVLELLNEGLSNKLIARKLLLSDNTVRRHVQDILEYFQVVSRAEAVVAARREALVG
ncbi:MAG: response regulator [Burkholderiales bacterium]